jgi:membrane dipeptidase
MVLAKNNFHPSIAMPIVAAPATEILAIRERGKTALILGFQNAGALERNVSGLDTFYQAGVRVFALNHLAHNDLSDSSRPFHDAATGLNEPDAHGGFPPAGLLSQT